MADFPAVGISSTSSYPVELSQTDELILAIIKRGTSGTASLFASGSTTALSVGDGSTIVSISTVPFTDATNTAFVGEASSAIGGLNQSIHILSTTSNVDLTATGAATVDLYTVPASRTAIIVGAILRVSNISGTVSTDAAVGIGINGSQDDIIASTSLTQLRTFDDAYHLTNSSGLLRIADAAEVIRLGKDTSSTGAATHEVDVDLLGYIL